MAKKVNPSEEVQITAGKRSHKGVAQARKVEPDWKEEFLALLKKVYPSRWRDELFQAELRALARRHNYQPKPKKGTQHD